ncbi:hypothetical protein M430DRAFT_97196 [Amorphotheca resinae ATCC 22711]|jgi:HSP20 family molecular chaperone IbpA|uniref:SHSP domain-containing protein n=1 Tax=Amorphotheca resinae ATCC 22711 TaxID=857342 RepID=A0A2T3B879_AMORE|nr:hypothetical protein M430DRAFT_97196 [Amorphotheca resinae ATCC 22711]PSS23063.1 hypothetical protein M430DRAFT_97196 [Amorphotheca resinae ATCC 22711]
MSFFPRGFISDPDYSTFTPLFRLLDEYGDYQSSANRPLQRSTVRTFSPKFDVKEVPDAYELHGELPGIEQKDVDIEFTDASTLTVRGRSERSYTSGTPPPGVIEEPKARGALPEGTTGGKAQQATVEDDKSEAQVTKKAEPKEPEAKYWVSERSVGEFSRSFSFPERIDQDQVRASMKNGILSIIVPKARKQERRKITIS